MTTITANLSRMFSEREPWDCSNSQDNLGPDAGRLTWDASLAVAAEHECWLKTPLADACEGMREWAREMGAWDADEIAGWSDVECLALYVQNVASELRDHLHADELYLAESLEVYASTDWNEANEYVVGHYYTHDHGDVMVDYYTGM